jgi:hypothetical protein
MPVGSLVQEDGSLSPKRCSASSSESTSTDDIPGREEYDKSDFIRCRRRRSRIEEPDDWCTLVVAVISELAVLTRKTADAKSLVVVEVSHINKNVVISR